MKFSIVSLFLLIPTVISLDSNCGGPSSACTPLTAAEKQMILDIHNELRDRVAGGGITNGPNHPSATNMNYLIWDDGLEAVAQSYSESCPGLNHNDDRQTEYYTQAQADNTRWTAADPPISNSNCALNGITPPCILTGENLALSSSTYTIASILAQIETGWFNEYLGYDYTTNTCNVSPCGHYTQMVWANTRYIGCGYSNGCTGGSGQWNAVFTCNYFPAGNFGTVPYESGAACSNCESDRTECNSPYSPVSVTPDVSQPYNVLCDGGACAHACDGDSDINGCADVLCDGDPEIDCNDGTDGLNDGAASRDICASTDSPTESPIPSQSPTQNPSQSPTKIPTQSPSNNPSQTPTQTPTNHPSQSPTENPSQAPIRTNHPTQSPTRNPSKNPTQSPIPSLSPTKNPSQTPTQNPSQTPTNIPTQTPTRNPTKLPTKVPTQSPIPTTSPTTDPTIDPTMDPTMDPSIDPTDDPTMDPTIDPTVNPTSHPTTNPTVNPTGDPTMDPTMDPTGVPSMNPTRNPTNATQNPTADPTSEPTIPTVDPTTTMFSTSSADSDSGESQDNVLLMWGQKHNGQSGQVEDQKEEFQIELTGGILAYAITILISMVCWLTCAVYVVYKRYHKKTEIMQDLGGAQRFV